MRHDSSRESILVKYHTLFFFKLGEMSQNLSSAAVMIVRGLKFRKLNSLYVFHVDFRR